MESQRLVDRLTRALGRAVRLRCPRCGETPLFRGWFSMAEACALCGLRFERAQGYFVGAIYVNYAMTAVLTIGGFFLLWGLTALSTAAQLALLLPVVILFPLWFFRYSRSLWLALEWLINREL
ncbi:MAG: hypothetical protein AUI57_09685 [Candidatus Rokubacteria bacterium 13_1_40CM_2_68_8]|nr:MAG: hypothetical protein AUI57_09685 [Candidatus Rokubacteria bacterium 13_1_40CM_2_68_8]PYN25661.1 MAG: hypothetical protein DMD99_07775 [Candidatus Rokubacteria bacterium]